MPPSMQSIHAYSYRFPVDLQSLKFRFGLRRRICMYCEMTRSVLPFFKLHYTIRFSFKKPHFLKSSSEDTSISFFILQ